MERKKYSIILVLLLLPLLMTASKKERIYKAFIHNQMQDWKAVIDEMENEKNKNACFLAELVNYQYGYIGFCIGMEQDKLAKRYLELAEENVDNLDDNNFQPSLVHAYKSAFYGYKIGLSPIKAPILGPKSVKQAELAVEADSTEPLGYIQQGNAQFYMPPVFGGSKTEAIKKFLKAMNLMEQNKAGLKNDWNYLNLLVLIAQSYEEMEKWEQAKIYYNQALAFEPEFEWVKNELLPGLIKKRNDE
jgi:tetratricopeptide (TPR) repeat protein